MLFGDFIQHQSIIYAIYTYILLKLDWTSVKMKKENKLDHYFYLINLNGLFIS